MLSVSHQWEPASLRVHASYFKTALAAGQRLPLAQLSFIAKDCQGTETCASWEKLETLFEGRPLPASQGTWDLIPERRLPAAPFPLLREGR